jgi:hypothetical protein
MIRRASVTVLLAASTVLAQPIPDRPDKLVFSPIKFDTPRVKDYKAKLKNGIPAYVAQTGKELVLHIPWRPHSV